MWLSCYLLNAIVTYVLLSVSHMLVLLPICGICYTFVSMSLENKNSLPYWGGLHYTRQLLKHHHLSWKIPTAVAELFPSSFTIMSADLLPCLKKNVFSEDETTARASEWPHLAATASFLQRLLGGMSRSRIKTSIPLQIPSPTLAGGCLHPLTLPPSKASSTAVYPAKIRLGHKGHALQTRFRHSPCV